MRRGDVIGGLFFLAVGILFVVYARSVDLGTWDEPGPGLLPFWSGVLLCGMSAALVVRTCLHRVRETLAFFPEKDSWKRVGATLLALIAYNALLKPLGFAPVTFLFVGFLVRFVFPVGWLTALVTAGLTTAGVRLVFVNLLGIQFPKGFLGF